MMTRLLSKSLLTAFSFLFLVAVSPVSNATTNPFGMSDMTADQVQTAEKGKCGEGKCGDGKKKSKCGEGKCGGDKKKGDDHKDHKDHKGKKKGKCGEGKCGGK